MRSKAVVLAVVASLMTLPVFSTRVSASRASDVIVREPIARKMVTSPQTSGPSGAPSGYQRLPWGLDRIDQRTNTLDGSYSFAKTGSGVKVYIVDSGVNATHADAFGQRVADGWSYRADSTALNNYKGQITAGYLSPCAYNTFNHQTDPTTFDRPAVVDTADKGKLDNDGHGTHVAGIVGGEYTGVAKDVTIVPVRVLDSCGVGTTTMVRLGLQWILDNHPAGVPAVINMSIGFDSSAQTIDTLIRQLIAAGIVVVVAAGNSSTTSCNTTPAGTPGTIAVGAIDAQFRETAYTNFGQCVDIFAPGSDVLSSWPKYGSLLNTYVPKTGTSMASPYVAGAVALYIQGKTTTIDTPTEAWSWLKSTSTCDAVTYFDTVNRTAAVQTPNRLLNVGSSAGPSCRPATATAVAGNTTATVSWTEPSGTNGSPITGYTATASPGGATCTTTTLMTCTLTGLTNNTTYTVSVTSANAVGASPAATATVTPVGLPLAVVNAAVTPADQVVTVSWAQPTGDGSGITYVVTATPGGATCSTTSTSCVITGLINSQQYSFSIVGSNQYGAAPAVSITGTPDGPPAVPAEVQSVVGSRTMTVSWPAVITTANVTYVAIANPGNIKCVTTSTSCVFTGLTNGIDYSVNVSTVSPSGKVTTSSVNYVARPGFTVLKTTVKRRSQTTLSTIVKSVSPGRKTWSETGACTIKGSKLVAPKTAATCKVRLRVAKSKSFPAMSTLVTVKVS